MKISSWNVWLQKYKCEFINTLALLWSTSYLGIFKLFLFFIKYNWCRSPFLAHINDYLVCSNSGYEFFQIEYIPTYIEYIICDKSYGEQTQYFSPFCYCSRYELGLSFTGLSKFKNTLDWILYKYQIVHVSIFLFYIFFR